MIVLETGFFPEYLPLLLIADPDEQAINEYIFRSRIFVCKKNDEIVGIAAVTKESSNTYEIKNIAVQKNEQGCGVGKSLILAIKAIYSGNRLIVGTADTSIRAQQFYERCGFVKCGAIKDFFINNYDKEIFEDGLQCKDMILFKISSHAESGELK
jgi:ribosomal protein S18 acetylase RimI-like enzyme